MTIRIVSPKEAERLLALGARRMTEEEEKELLRDLDLMARRGKWLKSGGSAYDPRSLADSIRTTRARRRLEEFERQSRARAKAEMEEARKNQELIEKGLHPIYSRVPGVVDFKVEGGWVWKRYYLAGGRWTDWERVSVYDGTTPYYVIPGKGMYTLPQVMSMAEIGTLSVNDLLSLPPEVQAAIVKRGFLNLMGMNEDIKKLLLETYDPETKKAVEDEVRKMMENTGGITIEVLQDLIRKARAGQLTEAEKRTLENILKELGAPEAYKALVNSGPTFEEFLHSGIRQVTWIEQTLNALERLATYGPLPQLSQWAEKMLMNVTGGKQLGELIIEGINNLKVVLGLEPLKTEDREKMEEILKLAGLARYAELVGGITGGIIGGVATKGMGLLPRLAGMAGGAMLGSQLTETISWAANSVASQAAKALESMELQKKLGDDRAFDTVRSYLMKVGESIDTLRTAYYAGMTDVAYNALKDAFSMLTEAKGYLVANREKFVDSKTYDELEALIANYESTLYQYQAILRKKDPTLPAIVGMVSGTRTATQLMSNLSEIKERNPVVGWDDLNIMGAYLSGQKALSDTISFIKANSYTTGATSLGTGYNLIPSFPMDKVDRIELMKEITKKKGKESLEVDVSSPKIYQAPYYQYNYYKAVQNDWINSKLMNKIYAIMPDWIKSILTMTPKFYERGKKRGYWYPYEMLSLVVAMLVTGVNFDGVKYLLDRYSR
ncbi:MAG: hypothetical protein NZ992_00695 [Candidatus Korarchaeum sp.]|nr:hypothetical protein [Candidatus Korarchaeum sp.]MDW8035514.1 hypothetical protein [Candidatus Korarchaeum sp.]